MSSRALFMTQANTLLQRLQRGLSAIELIHVPHSEWPRHSRIRPSSSAQRLRISVLDSSFNPPTLAHLALANSSLPQTHDLVASFNGYGDYDAKLLLLSVRNADKTLKPNDATYLQRLEMMVLLAEDVVYRSEKLSSVADLEQGAIASNVAVAIINEPTFVGKSSTLLSFLRQRLDDISSPNSVSTPSLQLTFLQGLDTLERFLTPRYYTSETAMHQSLRKFFSSDEDDSRVVCARRVLPSGQIVGSEQESQNEMTVMVKEFIESGNVVLIDIGEHERTFSSSEVREKVIRGDDGWRRLVSRNVGDYMERQKLYVTNLST